MLASERAAPAWGATCRVCSAAVPAGAPILFRSWGVDYACVACGWLRPDEREPHELRGGELRRVFFEWACPSELGGCGRDVVAEDRPAAGEDLRCPACVRESAGAA